ncbi:MAG: putative Glycosyl transferase, group 1 family [Candidatus Saccharibacteria bacterium]|nr:putative Glycosyl transferase, group 1 family [Candidatus Saccharibacteria bacterium]
MNILMLGWELPPHNSGGLGVACYHMSKALALKGASIDFVLPYTADHPGVDFMRVHNATKLKPEERIHLGSYDSAGVFERDVTELDTDAGSLMNMRDVQRHYVEYVEQLVPQLNLDVIHAHDWLTMEAGVRAKELTGAPLVVHVHATEFDRSGENYGNPIVHEIEQQALMMADRIIAVSNITKSIIMQRYGIPEEMIEVVHNAIDVDSFAAYEYDNREYRYFEALKHEGYTVVATLTRFTVQKGLTHLLRAAARACEKYDKFVFVLAGDGEQRDELIKLASDLGIADKVYFTGFVRGKQWRDIYSIADVFVMSSVSEPFGLTALEAAHHDSALIISRQSGVGEVLKNIFRFDFWDIETLANQMVGIALSPSLATSLKKGVKSEYDRLSWHDVATTCMQIYQRLRSEVPA